MQSTLSWYKFSLDYVNYPLDTIHPYLIKWGKGNHETRDMKRKANFQFYEPPGPQRQKDLAPLVALINVLQEHSRYWETGRILHTLAGRKAPIHSLTKQKGEGNKCPSKEVLGEGTLLGAPPPTHGQLTL